MKAYHSVPHALFEGAKDRHVQGLKNVSGVRWESKQVNTCCHCGLEGFHLKVRVMSVDEENHRSHALRYWEVF